MQRNKKLSLYLEHKQLSFVFSFYSYHAHEKPATSNRLLYLLELPTWLFPTFAG